MDKYQSSLKQMCLQCKTKPSNCNKKKCTRYNVFKDIENIKEELGVDLITFSKVLKQKFVFNKEKIKVDLLSIFFDFETNKLYMYGYIKGTFEDARLYAKDYGKTWALTREEWLENDK